MSGQGFGRGRRFTLPPSDGDDNVQGPAPAAHAPIPPVPRGRGSFLPRPQATDPQPPVPRGRGSFLIRPQATDPQPPVPRGRGSFLTRPQATDPQPPVPRGRGSFLIRPQATDPQPPVPRGRGSFLTRPQATDPQPPVESAFPPSAVAPIPPLSNPDGSGLPCAQMSAIPNAVPSGSGHSLGLDSQPGGSVVHPSQPNTLPQEPVRDRGHHGDMSRVMTNCIRLKFVDTKGVFHYMVRFNPSVDNARYRYDLMRQKLPLKKGIRCYDAGDILYLPERLEEDELTMSCIHPNDGSPIEMTIQFKRKLRMGECCSLLGTLIQNCLRELKLTRLGRHSYNHNSAQHIQQHKIQIWPGYVTSVEEREDGVFLTCEIVHRVLRFETCFEVLEALQSRGRDVATLAARQLVGCTVLTHYNNRLYRVHDILWDLTPLSKFTLKDGSKVSYRDYYKQQYNLDIKDLSQPMLLSKCKESKKVIGGQDIVLIPELCHMTGLTDTMRKDFRVMKDIDMHTRLTPQQRSSGLRTFIESLKANENVQKMLHDWGLEVPDDAVSLPARVLPPVEILFGRKRSVTGKADWGRDMRSNSVFRGVDITRWFLIFHQKDARRAESFTRMMLGTAQGMGVRVEKPVVLTLTSDRIDHLMTTLRSNVTPDTQAVVVLLSAQREDVYSAVKRFCSHERPVVSQVVLSQTLAKEERMRPIVQNIALQMEAKLGGVLWAVPTPLKRTMVCGIDTYHDKNDKNNSVGAFVASMDDMFTQYMSIASEQKPGVELTDSIFKNLICALSEWYSLHQGLPDRIIVYRDGVDEGRMGHVLEHEADKFLFACRKFCPSYTPKIVFIVVLKRIAARFFSIEGPRMDNALPGTVLDHTVTKRNFRDFLIVSQLARHGCAAPTHYVVLRDDANMSIDRIQRITYFFCFMYYNWPGTVRVPAPCLYAHKLAGLVGQHIRRVPDPSLNNQLHYL